MSEYSNTESIEGSDRGGSRRYFSRRRHCEFCADGDAHLDWKNEEVLLQYVSEHYKLLPRRMSGLCSKHQRGINRAIKRARQMALIPYTPIVD